MVLSGLASSGVRALGLAGKFAIVVLLARHFAPAEVGIFGLVSSTSAAAIMLIGLDFYVFNTRELVVGDALRQAVGIRDQLVVHAVSYGVALPLLSLTFLSDILPWRFVPVFSALVLAEHLSQEGNRLLVALSRPVLANVVLFCKTGLWAFACAAALLIGGWPRALEGILWFWVVGSVAGIAVTAFGLRALPWRRALRVPVDVAWIHGGLLKASRFFAGTLALKVIELSDRYIIKLLQGDAAVGIYSLYGNITAAVHAFCYAGVISLLYPRIVSAYARRDLAQYEDSLRNMLRGAVLMLVVTGLGCALLLEPVLELIGKPVYRDHLPVFWLLLGATALMVVGYVPHFALYARGQDTELMWSTFLALPVSVGLNLLLVSRYGILGAGIAALAAFAVLNGAKTCFWIFREAPVLAGRMRR